MKKTNKYVISSRTHNSPSRNLTLYAARIRSRHSLLTLEFGQHHKNVAAASNKQLKR